jgi:hypothetical protein
MSESEEAVDKGVVLSLSQLLEWAEINGIILLPSEPQSKKPGKWLSTRNVYSDKIPPTKDSFHNLTPERLKAIESFWKFMKLPRPLKLATAESLSASVDTSYPTDDGFTIGCIDVDTDTLYEDALKIPLFLQCAAVRGKKGVKLLFKLDAVNQTPEPLTQYYTPEALKDPESKIPAAIEVFTHDKLALVFGEHPDSTTEKPIFYKFVRGSKDPLPILKWGDVKPVIEEFAAAHKLSTRPEFQKTSSQQQVHSSRNAVRTGIPQHYPDHGGLRVEDFLIPIKGKPYQNGIRGEHPIHGSTGGQNLSVDLANNRWYCFRCGSGGGAIEAAAVAAGIIDCSEARPEWRTPERMAALKKYLQEKGYKIPDSLERKIVKPLAILGSNIQETDQLPDEFPNTSVVLVKAPPRSGKTHRAVQEMCHYPTACYFTHSHSVAEQATRIFGEVRKPEQTGVHLEGRDRSCRNKGKPCGKCKFYPLNMPVRHIFNELVKGTLIKAKVLTKDKVSEDYCPYYVLREAAKSASHVFTVIDYLQMIPPKDFTVIDEDTCIPKFYPASVELLEVYNGRKRDSVTRKFENTRAQLAGIKEIVERRSKRLRIRTEKDRDRAKSYTILLKCIEIIARVCEICPVGIHVSRKKLIKNLNRIDFSLPEGDRIRARNVAREIEYELNKANTFVPFLDPILFPFEKERFTWIGKNPASLFMIADEERRIVDPPFGKLLVIGDTRAHLFVESLGREYVIVPVNRFAYADQFLLVLMQKEKGVNGKHSIKELIQNLNPDPNLPHRVPCLVLTGSKHEQEKLKGQLGGIAHMCRDENRVGMMWNYNQAAANIFYQGSALSRGVDVEFFPILFVYGTNFVNPYWHAVKNVAEKEKNAARKGFAQAVINAIVNDETTNSILRISPTKKKNDGRTRLVIMQEDDEGKIRDTVLNGMNILTADHARISDFLRGIVRNSYNVSLQTLKGYSREECGLSCGTYIGELSDNAPEMTTEDFIKELGKNPASSSDPDPDPIPAFLVGLTCDIIMTDLQRRAKERKRITEDALLRWVKTRIPKGVPDQIREPVAREAINRLIRGDFIGRETNLSGTSTIVLIKTYCVPALPAAVKAQES